MRKLLLSCWGLLFLVLSYAQTTTITGKITDEKDGTPIVGATVKARGGNSVAISQPDGTFSIKVDAGTKILVVSFVGYADKDVAIIGNDLVIALSQSSQSLSEVVVVGYGTKIKRDITGSVAKVGAKELTNTPVTSFESAIQGRASGVYVQQQNGKLGQGINIRIRGASSVSAGNEPLYVVDGIPIVSKDLSSTSAPTDALADLNMNDIESIDILKDASATAIYGSQGSNGVVIITTKKGKSGTSKIDFGYFTGFQKPTGKREFMNAQQFVDFFEQASLGAAKVEYD
ncbi:MAG: TonB-dependent receptor plug domain-containing protein, partial [Panacibacter sp.]